MQDILSKYPAPWEVVAGGCSVFIVDANKQTVPLTPFGKEGVAILSLIVQWRNAEEGRIPKLKRHLEAIRGLLRRERVSESDHETDKRGAIETAREIEDELGWEHPDAWPKEQEAAQQEKPHA